MTDSAYNFTDDRTRQLLIQYITDYVNRGYKARDAVAESLKALADHLGTAGQTGKIKISEEAFEALVAQVETMIERYRQAQERGAKPVGGGVYVEVAEQDEIDELTKKAT